MNDDHLDIHTRVQVDKRDMYVSRILVEQDIRIKLVRELIRYIEENVAEVPIDIRFEDDYIHPMSDRIVCQADLNIVTNRFISQSNHNARMHSSIRKEYNHLINIRNTVSRMKRRKGYI